MLQNTSKSIRPSTKKSHNITTKEERVSDKQDYEQNINQEDLRARFNPDGSPLRNHQLKLLEMLRYFDRICRKNDIKYWLSSGNCIGAVRHGGFIPWDDDIDVEMMKEDYLKLLRVFKENEDYALQTSVNDPYFVVPFAKLRDKHTVLAEELNGRKIDTNYKYKGLFIDVLYIEAAPWLAVRILDTLTYYLAVWGARLDGTKKNRLFHFSKRVLFSTERMMQRLFDKRSKRLFPTYGSGFHNPRAKEDNLTDTIMVKYEGEEFPIPRNYASYLQRIYGNYMRLPNLDNVYCHIPSLKSVKKAASMSNH